MHTEAYGSVLKLFYASLSIFGAAFWLLRGGISLLPVCSWLQLAAYLRCPSSFYFFACLLCYGNCTGSSTTDRHNTIQLHMVMLPMMIMA